jgi:hypothetical protein
MPLTPAHIESDGCETTSRGYIEAALRAPIMTPLVFAACLVILVAYNRALELDPNSAVAWSGKAMTLRSLRRTTEAEEAERRARALGALSVAATHDYFARSEVANVRRT